MASGHPQAQSLPHTPDHLTPSEITGLYRIHGVIDHRFKTGTSPKYKHTKNKKVVHRKTFLVEAKRLTELEGLVWTDRRELAAKRVWKSLGVHGALVNWSNQGHCTIQPDVLKALNREFLLLSEEDREDPFEVRKATERAISSTPRRPTTASPSSGRKRRASRSIARDNSDSESEGLSPRKRSRPWTPATPKTPTRQPRGTASIDKRRNFSSPVRGAPRAGPSSRPNFRVVSDSDSEADDEGDHAPPSSARSTPVRPWVASAHPSLLFGTPPSSSSSHNAPLPGPSRLSGPEESHHGSNDDAGVENRAEVGRNSEAQERRIQTLEAYITQLEREAAERQIQLADRDTRIQALTNEKTEAEGQATAANEARDLAIQERDAARDQVDTLNGTIDERDADIQLLQGTITQITEARDLAIQERDAARDQVAELGGTIVERDAFIQLLQETISQRNQQVLDLQAANIQQGEQIGQLNTVITNVEAQRDHAQAAVDALLPQLHERDLQLEVLQASNVEKDAQITQIAGIVAQVEAQAQTTVDGLHTQLHTSLAAQGVLEEQLHAAHVNHHEELAHAAHLHVQLADADHHIAALADELALSQTQLATAQADMVATQTADAEAFATQAELHQQEQATLQTEINHLNDSLAEVRADRDNHSSLRAQAEDDLEVRDGELTQAEETLAVRDTQLAEANEKIHVLESQLTATCQEIVDLEAVLQESEEVRARDAETLTGIRSLMDQRSTAP